MDNIKIAITESGTTTLATAGKYCDRNIDVEINIPTGGVEVEPIILTGDCEYACAGVLSAKFIEMYGDKISTEDITSPTYMFNHTTLKSIPFDINVNPTVTVSLRALFGNSETLESSPNVNHAKPDMIGYLFTNDANLRSIPEDFGQNWDWSTLHTASTSTGGYVFNGCHSLRKIPTFFAKNMWNCGTGTYTNQNSCFKDCYVLDEIIGYGISSKRYTSNTFSNFVPNCFRLANLTFETNEDGSPKVVEWKSQTLDLSPYYLGYGSSTTNILGYNSGITADKEVKDDATYQALKNDPDWFTTNLDYCRYNHDSAVNTINSLPDSSAYGTNTIKFRGAAGALTDGGAINTLTEEEIAVAAAKGWTVSLV